MEERNIGTVCNRMNVGHIRQMKIVSVDDIVSMNTLLHFSGYRFSAEFLKLSDDTKIFSCEFFRKEAKFTEKQTSNTAGPGYEYSLDWTFRASGELLDFLVENEERRWVLFFSDQNGNSYVAGQKENGLKLSFGRLIDASNFVKLQLAGNGWHPVFFIDNINLLAMDIVEIDLRKYAAANFTTREGDAINEPLVFRDDNGNIETLTGSSFKMQLRREDGSIVTSFTMGNGFSLQNYDTELLMRKTDVIPSGQYNYDLQRTYPDSLEYTIMVGKFTIEPQITT